jgi:hypothetical protein
MKVNDICSKQTLRTLSLVIGGAVLLLMSVTLVVPYKTAMLLAQTRQTEVAKRGAQVMPFDLEKTIHVFQKLEDGGLQKVVVKDASNKEQIPLIQSHLKEESEKFRKGDFSDPAKIHGQDMPGLAELKAGAKQIDIRYTSLPDGAQVQYTTKNTKLVAALHHWFDAQLSDHGHHASGHMQ